MNSPTSASHPESDGAEAGSHLVQEVAPFLKQNNDAALLRHLRRYWTIGALSELLQGSDATAGHVAAYCLGLIGGPVSIMPLARALHHDDSSVADSAEDALWRTWFDAAGVGVRRRLQRAADLMDEHRYESAIAVLTDVIERHPDFAESYHQRATARFLAGDHAGAFGDCKKVIDLNAVHFGAHATMGHNHAHLGQYHEALACYQAALRINPRMEGIRQSMRRIRLLTKSSHSVF